MSGSTIAETARTATLRAPASTDTLALVRLFAASIGRHTDLSVEAVEDLKLALTEVCSAAIEAAASDTDVVDISVSWLSDPSEIVVRVSTPLSSFSMGDAGSDDRARLLTALGLELLVADDGLGVEFAVPVSWTP